jgi:hypothetical protein
MRISFIPLRAFATVLALIAIPAIAPAPVAVAATVPLKPHPVATIIAKPSQHLTVSPEVVSLPISRDNISSNSPTEAMANVGTNYEWAKLVLIDGGWATSDNNVTVLVRWMRQENGTNNWWNRDNPMNNSYNAPYIGQGGTGTYVNLEVAAQNVADALHSGIGSGYPAIVASFAASADPSVTTSAIWASGWSSSHYANGTHWSTTPVPEVKSPAGTW